MVMRITWAEVYVINQDDDKQGLNKSQAFKVPK